MKQNKKNIYLGLILAGLFALFIGTTSANGNSEEEEAYSGPAEPAAREVQLPPQTEAVDSEQIDEKIVTIAGTVNHDFQLVTEQGDVYEIAETDSGDEMVRYPGENVNARGTVAIVEEGKVLSVISFIFTEN